MKKVLLVAVALASVNAFATRARVTALGNSPHLVDTQMVYDNPAYMMVLGDFANFESGATATGVTPNSNAEGMITRSLGDSKLSLGLGHQNSNASVWGLRSPTLTGIPTIKSQQNTVNLGYGMKMNDLNVGGSVIYSNYQDKAAAGGAEKESSAGIRLGAFASNWDAKLGIGLMNTYENATAKFKGTTGFSVGGGYWWEDTYFNAFAEMAGFKTENTAGTELIKFDTASFRVGALKSIKKEGNELFYGIGLTSSNSKSTSGGADTKSSSMFLPITLGMEVDAASWLTLRGSITQSTLIATQKIETPAATSVDFAPGSNNTQASIGAGLKFNKFVLDGTLTGLTGTTATQQVNGNALLGLVGVTYMF